MENENIDLEVFGPAEPIDIDGVDEMAAIDNVRKQVMGSLRNAPALDETSTWRSFELSFDLWRSYSGFDNEVYAVAANLNERKSLFVNMIKGSLLERVQGVLRGSPAWDGALTVNAYVTVVKGIFAPAAEQQVSRTEFNRCRQGKQEPVQAFVSRKVALYCNAFAEAERNHWTLKDAVINSLESTVVKRELRRRNDVVTTADITRVLVEIVSNEREAFHGEYAEATSLDGLALSSLQPRTSTHDDYGDERMDIGRLGGGGAESRKCHRCGNAGHLKANCRTKPENFKKKTGPQKKPPPKQGAQGAQKPKSDKSKLTCFKCQKKGHFARDCRSSAAPKSKAGVKGIDGAAATDPEDPYEGEDSE